MKPDYGVVAMARRWNDLTLSVEEETKERIRLLRRAGMLPDGRLMRSQPMGDKLTSHFIIAMMCSERHDKAPEALARYASLTCVNSDTPFAGVTLSQFMADALARSRSMSNPFQIVYCTFNLCRPIVEVLIVDTRLTKDISNVLVFGNLTEHSSPIERVNRLSGRVIEGIGRGE